MVWADQGFFLLRHRGGQDRDYLFSACFAFLGYFTLQRQCGIIRGNGKYWSLYERVCRDEKDNVVVSGVGGVRIGWL